MPSPQWTTRFGAEQRGRHATRQAGKTTSIGTGKTCESSLWRVLDRLRPTTVQIASREEWNGVGSTVGLVKQGKACSTTKRRRHMQREAAVHVTSDREAAELGKRHAHDSSEQRCSIPAQGEHL